MILRRSLYCAPFGMLVLAAQVPTQQANSPTVINTPNPAGVAQTISTNGAIDLTGPFFQSLGTNGRSCVTCHVPGEGWSVSVAGVRQRFENTDGKDPIFRLNDGANAPNANVSNGATRKKAYSMLLNHGVIRVEQPIPPLGEFELLSAEDPYHYASAAGLSLFRRPLPSTNLRFISTVMWDGREVDPLTPMTIANLFQTNKDILLASLSHQSLDATNGHAQGNVDLTTDQRNGIVNFEMGLHTAQISGPAGPLDAGVLGGPTNLSNMPFYIGINDNVNDPNGPFNGNSMTMFGAWSTAKNDYRKAIARGEALFNSKPITISGVNGLNDNPYFGSPSSFVGTCTTCHNTPNSGNHSLAIALNIGLADESRRSQDMPLYWLRNKTTGQVQATTDPGLALITGKWKDIGRFKGPVLRGLASRAPYFHNGSANNLNEVLDFYTDRFGVQFTKKERSDLVAFLNSL